MKSVVRIVNETGARLDIAIEPDGDCVQIPPSKECRIVGQETNRLEVTLVFEAPATAAHEDSITLYSDYYDEVYVDGEQVR